MIQKIFTEAYAEKLKNDVNTELYKVNRFAYDSSCEEIVPGLVFPDNLLNKLMIASNDYEAGIALYEAFKTLTPLEASYEPFWIYLAHVNLYSYMRNRFPKVKEAVFDNKQYILDHWFFDRGRIRQQLAGLYWSVRNTIDETVEGKEQYKYTKYLFQRMDFRTRRLASSTLFRHREMTIGILKFMMDNEELFSQFFEGKSIYCIMHLNQLGAIRQLSALDRNFVIEELKSKIHILEKLTNRQTGWSPIDVDE